MNCEHCNSTFGYVRIKKKEWICRNCGETSKIKTAKKMIKRFAGLE